MPIDDRDASASEFGGKPGIVQPAPHPLSPAEQAMLERNMDPSDANDSVEKVRIRKGGSPSR